MSIFSEAESPLSIRKDRYILVHKFIYSVATTNRSCFLSTTSRRAFKSVNIVVPAVVAIVWSSDGQSETDTRPVIGFSSTRLPRGNRAASARSPLSTSFHPSIITNINTSTTVVFLYLSFSPPPFLPVARDRVPLPQPSCHYIVRRAT